MRANKELMAGPVGVLTTDFDARNGVYEEVPLRFEGDVGTDIPHREGPSHILERGKVVKGHASNLEFFDLWGAIRLRRRYLRDDGAPPCAVGLDVADDAGRVPHGDCPCRD